MSLRSRLLRLEHHLGWSGIRLSEECGLSRQSLNRAKQRNATIDPKTAHQIVQRVGCKLEWLAYGEGDWGLSTPGEPKLTPARRSGALGGAWLLGLKDPQHKTLVLAAESLQVEACALLAAPTGPSEDFTAGALCMWLHQRIATVFAKT